MIELRDSLLEAGLFDLRFQGTPYIWSNKQPANPVAKKLDRFLANDAWFSSYPDSLATFLPPDFSYHTPCTVNLNSLLPSAGSKPFKFLNYLTKHPNFSSLVEDTWILLGTPAENLSSFSAKLKALKAPLKTLNKNNYSQIQERVRLTNDLLNNVQVQALSHPSPQIFQEEFDLHQKLAFLKVIEEEFYRQRSRINWLKEGDHNTSFFHRSVKSRNAYNAIRSLSSSSGTTTSNPIEMSRIAVDHFQSILAPHRVLNAPLSCSWITCLTNYTCSVHLQHAMTTLPSVEEITKTVMKLNPNKAPGPDGLTAGFFKAAWGVVGSELIRSISNFFATAFLPRAINSTILSLVPKRPGATSISDYRPISCCNTIYKVISKLLVVRLKPLLPDFILPNQTAFIKGRLLLENTTLATELIQDYHSNKGSPRMTIKVDLAKAFDTINWSFMLNCLRGVHVPEAFIRWIEACVCTPYYSVGFNGSINGFFKGKRGLRQGDPLSPYLFVIVMNCLSLLLNKGARDGRFGYHAKCEDLGITHLCFADDLLIFTDGSLSSTTSVLAILDEFKTLSGLAINIQKTSFIAAGISAHDLLSITTTTGLSHATLPLTYLGLPLISTRLTISQCTPLIQRIKERLNTWAARMLSYAGRLLLLKTVIDGITNFWSSAFVLPKKCIKDINSLCSTFLWKGNLEGSHTARVAWSSIIVSKEEGGLGLRDLLAWNKACILKLIWLIFFRKQSLWVAWFTSAILQNNTHQFWFTKIKQRFSWFTKKLLKYRSLIYPWIQQQVGNGRQTFFWYSNWSPMGDLSSAIGAERIALTGIPMKATLADLWISDSWVLPPARSDIMIQIFTHLSTICLTNEEDSYQWSINGATSNVYSTSTIYDILKTHRPIVNWSKEIWYSGSIPRHSFLCWLFLLNRCPTRDRLLYWGLATDANCLLCNSASESRNHLFFNCDYSSAVWEHALIRLGLPTGARIWDSNLLLLQNLGPSKVKRTVTLLAWQSTIYHLWRERNNRLHRSSSRPYSMIWTLVDSSVRKRISSMRETRPAFASRLIQFWFRGWTSSLPPISS